MTQYIFKRYEKKYIISTEQYFQLFEKLKNFTVPDDYGESNVCNIYCDTPDYRIIRTSIQKPKYKEKFRLRCYGTPTDSSKCFLELKKKYKGIVYKRRIKNTYFNALNFLRYNEDEINECQIKSEIEYFRKIHLNPTPKINIFYRRTALYDKNDSKVRITFDSNLLYRDYDLDLKNGIYGEKIIPQNKMIMEIKTDGGMPLWLVKILDESKIYPTSFSKYGTAFNIMLNKNLKNNIFIFSGGKNHVR